MRIHECPACHKPFSVTTSGNYPSRDRESIICPHCQHICETNLVRFDYDTAPLTPSQEAAYFASKGGRRHGDARRPN
jgi:hypothetical protein